MPPLHEAAEQDDVGKVQGLLQARADILQKAANGWTCLHFASLNGHVDVAKVLVAEGGQELLMATNKYGGTCLHVASLNGQADVAKVLVAEGGQELLMATNKDGDTCLHMALEKGQLEVAKVLVVKAGEEALVLLNKDGRSCLSILVEGYLMENRDDEEEDVADCIVRKLLEVDGERVMAEAKERYMMHGWIASVVEWYEEEEVKAKLLRLHMGCSHKTDSRDCCLLAGLISRTDVMQMVRDQLMGLVGSELAALREQATLGWDNEQGSDNDDEEDDDDMDGD